MGWFDCGFQSSVKSSSSWGGGKCRAPMELCPSMEGLVRKTAYCCFYWLIFRTTIMSFSQANIAPHRLRCGVALTVSDTVMTNGSVFSTMPSSDYCFATR